MVETRQHLWRWSTRSTDSHWAIVLSSILPKKIGVTIAMAATGKLPAASVPGYLVATGPGDPVVAAPGDKEPEQYSELSGARQRCVSVPMMMSFVIVCGSGLSG